MAKKPKNLNENSLREFYREQRDMYDEKLKEVPELYQVDFKNLLISYKKSLHRNEFSENTKKSYISKAAWFIKFYTYDDKPLTKEDVIDCKTYLTDKYEKVSTINSYITSIGRFLAYCDVAEFRVSKVRAQRENTLTHRIYAHEYKRMWMRAKKNGLVELYFIIRLMGETGIRVNELPSFTSKSIFNNHVEVDNKGKIRKVPLPGELGREIRKYVKTNKIEGPIVTLKYKAIHSGLKEVAAQCKINKKKIHPHAFRHYFGFNFVNKKGEPKLTQLSDILGHSSVETTRVYTRGTLEDYLKTVEDIG